MAPLRLSFKTLNCLQKNIGRAEKSRASLTNQALIITSAEIAQDYSPSR